jgi:hypothetical protein
MGDNPVFPTPYAVTFHPDTIQDRDDYKDLDERYFLTVEEDCWPVMDRNKCCSKSSRSRDAPESPKWLGD